MNEWTLIVLIAGLLPPQGFVQYGFETKQHCLLEAAHYCTESETAPSQARPPQFKCKCEKGLLPPGSTPPPIPPLKKGR